MTNTFLPRVALFASALLPVSAAVQAAPQVEQPKTTVNTTQSSLTEKFQTVYSDQKNLINLLESHSAGERSVKLGNATPRGNFYLRETEEMIKSVQQNLNSERIELRNELWGAAAGKKINAQTAQFQSIIETQANIIDFLSQIEANEKYVDSLGVFISQDPRRASASDLKVQLSNNLEVAKQVLEIQEAGFDKKLLKIIDKKVSPPIKAPAFN